MGKTRTVWTDGVLSYKDTVLSPDNSMWADCPLQAILSDPHAGFYLREDFTDHKTGYYGLSSTVTDGGAAGIVTATHGGQLKIDSVDSADNDEIYVGSTYTFIVPTAGRTIWYECEAKFTEAATDDANIGIGFSSLYNANMLLDNGAGPAANYLGALFFKVDGGTTWSCEVSNAAAQTTNAGVATRTSGSFVRYGIKLTGLTLATFYINGAEVTSITTNLPAAATGLFYGVKNGGANPEVLYVDWHQLAMTR